MVNVYKSLKEQLETRTIKDKVTRLDKYCPSFSSTFITDIWAPFVNTINPEDRCSNSFELFTAMAYKRLLESNGGITYREIQEIRDDFSYQYNQALSTAESLDKKLLVLIGESHGTSKSALIEWVLISHLKFLGFDKILAEYDETMSEQILSDDSSIIIGVGGMLLYHFLDMHPVSIDSAKSLLKDSKDSGMWSSTLLDSRESIMIHNIAASDHDNQVAIVGVNHLKAIADNNQIKEKFVVLPINVSDNLPTIPKEMKILLKLSYPEEGSPPLPDNTIDYFLTSNIEGFSERKLFQFFYRFISLEAGSKKRSYDEEMYAKFNIASTHCKNFGGKMKGNLEFAEELFDECGGIEIYKNEVGGEYSHYYHEDL